MIQTTQKHQFRIFKPSTFDIIAILDELTPKRGFSVPKIPNFVLKSPKEMWFKDFDFDDFD